MSSLKATRLRLLDFRSVPMRTFHITWVTFFTCFFGWFGIAPLMPVIRQDLQLTQEQIGNSIIASVAITIFARLFFGWLCDRIGPRLSYTLLLILGAFPVMLIGLSPDYQTFLLFRLAIGMIGASFVITQYHTSVMFAPQVVGTANATAAGWGNLGGGVTLMVMPLLFSGIVALGYTPGMAWRYSMVIPGAALLIMGIVYYFFTQDTPEGNVLKRKPGTKEDAGARNAGWLTVCRDYRVWCLFLAYGACFGIEITLDNIATLYFVDNFDLGLKEAGIIAGLFGMMNLFARALGGIFGDRAGKRFGLWGRMLILGLFLLLEGVGIIVFSSLYALPWAIFTMLFFALFLKMSNGATYSVVPFLHRKSLGIVSGIVGAGGNVGAVVAGFLFKAEGLTYRDCLGYIGMAVCVIAGAVFLLSMAIRATGDVASAEAEPVLKESLA